MHVCAVCAVCAVYALRLGPGLCNVIIPSSKTSAEVSDRGRVAWRIMRLGRYEPSARVRVRVRVRKL